MGYQTRKIQLLFYRDRTEAIINRGDKLFQISIHQKQFLAFHLQFAEVEQLIYQRQKFLCIPVNGVQLPVDRLVRNLAFQDFQRCNNQCKRGTLLMADIRKESELHLVQFFFLPLGFFMLHSHQLPVVPLIHIYDKTI